MITIILGALRVIGLQGLSLVAGLALKPIGKLVLGIGGAGLVLGAVYLIWPSGNAVERAVLAALGERQTITNLNVDEEKHDNDWLVSQEQWMAAEREKATRAAGAGADRVIWRADDEWLCAKRVAQGH